MRNFLRISLLFIFSAVSLNLFAQESNGEKFSIGMQIRTRGEYRNGALNPREEGQLPALFVNERARLSFGYETNLLEVKFSAQHVGVWGQDAMIDKNGRLALSEAWARVRLSDSWNLRLGRQQLSYDDERLLGGLDWNVAGRFHDALKFEYQKNQHKLHAILAFNQNDEKIIGGTYYNNTTTKFYKSMQTLWYNYKSASNKLGVSLIFMNIGQESAKSAAERGNSNYMQTFGTHITGNGGAFNFIGSAYLQTGKMANGTNVMAYMLSAKMGAKIDDCWGATVGLDLLSGDNSGTNKFEAFNPLYGTHHKFYGTMDYFYVANFAGNYNPGLLDIQAGGTLKLSKKVDMNLTYHYFATASKVTTLAKSLGSEIDYQINIKVAKDVSISAGYSTMFGTSTMDIVKGGSHKAWQDWAWISLNINPKRFF